MTFSSYIDIIVTKTFGMGCDDVDVNSAGGVVVMGNSVLLLRKLNGDWVLPKGRVETGEEPVEAAVREVREESGIKTEVLSDIGYTVYDFRGSWNSRERISKRVDWYLMVAKNMRLIPQRREGFVEAKFIHIDRIDETVKYNDELDIIKKALVIYDENYREFQKK